MCPASPGETGHVSNPPFLSPSPPPFQSLSLSSSGRGGKKRQLNYVLKWKNLKVVHTDLEEVELFSLCSVAHLKTINRCYHNPITEGNLCCPKPGFLSPIDILGWIIVCVAGGGGRCPVHCRIFSSPRVLTIQHVSRHYQISAEGKIVPG